jgi:1-acyl-sn-glycerol-3-phosphate acyltransferase
MGSALRHARACGRLAALAASTAALYAAAAAGSTWRRGSDRQRFRVRMFQRWSRAFASIIGVRIRVDGSPPRPPFLLVSNHLGYIDVITFGAVIEAVFVSRADVAVWPLLGRLARFVNTLFVDRARAADIPRVMAGIESTLADGVGVVLFPEGTSTSGDGVRPFKPPLLEFPVRAGCEVWAAAVRYETPDGEPPPSQAVCWWGDMTFVDHFYRMLLLPGFDARVAFHPHPLRADDRKALARILHSAVSALHAGRV